MLQRSHTEKIASAAPPCSPAATKREDDPKITLGAPALRHDGIASSQGVGFIVHALFRGFSLCPVRLDRVSSEILGVSNATQRGENRRKTSFLNYESPALTAELEARRAGTREHRIFNVQRPIFTGERGQFTTNRIVDYLDARQRYGAN